MGGKKKCMFLIQTVQEGVGRGDWGLLLRLVIYRLCLIFLWYYKNLLNILCVQPVAITWGNLPFSHLLKVLIIQPRQQCEQMFVISIIYLVLITILCGLLVWEQAGNSCRPDVPSPTCNSSCLCPRGCSQGHGSRLHGRDTTSLPGFENLTMGYNKYLRPYFGGMLAPYMGAFKISL